MLQFVCECDVVKDTGKEEYLRPFIHIGLDWISAYLNFGMSGKANDLEYHCSSLKWWFLTKHASFPLAFCIQNVRSLHISVVTKQITIFANIKQKYNHRLFAFSTLCIFNILYNSDYVRMTVIAGGVLTVTF